MIDINRFTDGNGASPDGDPFGAGPHPDWKVVQMKGSSQESEFSGTDELLDVFLRYGLRLGRSFGSKSGYRETHP